MPSILIVTGWFSPSRQIGARRVERMAAQLLASGWQVTVLCPHPEYMAPIDGELAGPPVERLGVHVLTLSAVAMARLGHLRGSPPPDAATAQRSRAKPGMDLQPIRAKAKKIASRTLRLGDFPDASIGMMGPALAAVAGRRFDLVLGSLPWRSVGPVAAALARVTGAKLVLDYRDPWTEGVGKEPGQDPHPKAWHRWLEDRCLAQASLVTGVSPTIVRWLADRARCPVELVTNGYLTAARRLPPAPSPPIRLVYAGSLAYGRDLTPVLQAVAALGLGPQQLVVDVAGPHGAGVLAQAAAMGLDPALVVDHGALSSSRALEMVQGGHVALVLGSPGFEYAYPGKIFEILSLDRPMWLLSPPGADAQTLIEDHQLGWVSDPTNSAEVQRTLAAILRGPPPQPRDLESLQAPVVMNRLEKLLRQVAGV
jgi:predicted dinucleotide-binding enzyme